MIQVVTDWLKLILGYEEGRMADIASFKRNHIHFLNSKYLNDKLGLTNRDVRIKLKLKAYLFDKVYIPARAKYFK